MEITINIECETIDEFLAHLQKIQKQAITKSKYEKLDTKYDEFINGKRMKDCNCYGTHQVIIKNKQ